MNRYSRISTLEELDAAQKELSREIKYKGEELGSQVDTVRDSFRNTFSGARLLSSGVKKVSKFIPLDTLLLYGVRILRKKLMRR